MKNRQDLAAQSLWMIAAGLSFALMALCIKVATTDMGIIELCLWRSIGGVAFLFLLLRARRQSLAMRHPMTHFYRAAWGLAAVLMFYYAIDQLEPSIAYALNYTAPILFILLTAVHLREKLDPRILLAAIGSFSGVLFLLRPDFESTELIAGMVGVASGVCAAVAFLMIRKLGKFGEGGLRTVFFFNGYGAIFCAAVLAFTPSDIVGISIDNALPVLGVIIFATTGQMTLTHSLNRGASATSAALSYSGVFFSVLIDSLIRGVDFSVRDYTGFAMIVGFGAVSIWLAKKRSKIEVPM